MDLINQLIFVGALLIVLSVVIFLVGLVSEQISSLRFEGRQ